MSKNRRYVISNGVSEPKSPYGIHLGCPHNPGRAVICVEGFWGVRHRIEQLIEYKDKVDATANINKANRAGSIWLATNLDNDTPTLNLKNDLNKILPNTCKEYTSDNNLFEFWDKMKRPVAWIVLGHMEDNQISLVPEAGRSNPDLWLKPKNITDYLIQYRSWDQPKPMIFLLACESARTQLSDLNGFVQAFKAIGASAIIGTECIVFSSLAAHFAREVILKLWNRDNPMTLGEAIQSFNRGIIQMNIPLPFVFNCIGSADLKLVIPNQN